MKPCLFCGSTEGPADDEHVIPKWARRAFNIQGPVTAHTRDHPGADREQVGQMKHLNIVLRDAICRTCNNEWLASIEKKAARILKPMAVDAQRTELDAAAQALIALWAVKTGLLLELALRQQYPGQRTVQGYAATPQELAWLREQSEPPPRSMVWLGCWDCQKASPVNYEPSGAALPTQDGATVTGHLTTFTLGYVALQIYTVDFIEAQRHGAPVWNTRPPAPLREALPRIWPPQLVIPGVPWPPPAFAQDRWPNLVTWNGALRPDTKPNPAA
jgi:hypothetical protein